MEQPLGSIPSRGCGSGSDSSGGNHQHLEQASRPWAMASSLVDLIGFFILLQVGVEWYLLPVRESHTVVPTGSAAVSGI